MEKVEFYDKDLVNKIVNNISFENDNIKEEEKFWGYKKNKINKFFDFFFGIYQKKYLVFTFRLKQNLSSITRVYVTYENYLKIRQIIISLLNDENIDRSIYLDYICYEYDNEYETIENTNTKIKSFDIDVNINNDVINSDINKFDYDVDNTDIKEIKVKDEFFKYDMDVYYKKSNDKKYINFGKEIVNYLIDLINSKINNEKRRTAFVLYKRLNQPQKFTIGEIASAFGTEKTEISSYIQRNIRILSRSREYLINKINEIVGPEQYNYLIDGVIESSNHGFLFLIFDLICNGVKIDAMKYKRKFGRMYDGILSHRYPYSDIFKLSSDIDYSKLKGSLKDDDEEDQKSERRTYIVGAIKETYNFGRCVKVDDVVTVKFLSSGMIETYKIKFLHHEYMPTLESYTYSGISRGVRDVIYANDINQDLNEISDESPIGKKLIGRAVNDIILIESPEGNYAIQIIGINNQK